MPNLTTPFLHLGGRDIDKDMDDVQNWSIALIDELKYILCNLDAGNCMEAGKVQAKNIDCSKARIHNAQIQSLTADKLTAGTIDAEEIKVINIDADNINTGMLNSGLVNVGNSDSYGSVALTGDTLVFYEKVKDESGKTVNVPRIMMGRDKANNYIFTVQNRDATQGIYMDSDGNIYITGHFTGGSISSETTIDVNTDARIGRRLILKDKNEATAGYEEAGIISVSEGVMQILANNSRSINLHTDGNVNLNGKSIMANGVEIATQADIDEIKEEIRRLRNEISALGN